ncbi:MAG: signal peptidase II [Planctomycetota bacterium]|nr:signal peptidase II [Planctomycetota bacterium]
MSADEKGAVPGPLTGKRLVKLKVLCAILFAVWLAFDLWSKADMQDRLGLVPGQPRGAHQIDVIPGFFAWQGTWNPGVTFGFAPRQTKLILALTGIATIALLAWFGGTRSRSRALHIGLALILAGAVGNLYDRWQWGEVRDFILVYLGTLEKPTWTWPNFNVADSGIVVGVGLVLWDALFGLGAKEAKRVAEERKAAKEASRS